MGSKKSVISPFRGGWGMCEIESQTDEQPSSACTSLPNPISTKRDCPKNKTSI